MDTSVFDIFARIAELPKGEEKQAFTPSPAVEQEVMAQAQGGGGGAPPGADPSAMGAGGAPPGMGGGAPAGPDPSMMGAGGAPPAPPTDAPSPIEAKLDRLIQVLESNQQGGGGGAGQPGKPNLASMKFEPQHFHQMAHDISAMKAVVGRLAEAMGIEVPASAMLNMSAPGAPVPGVPQPGAQSQMAAGGAATPDQQQPPPSQIAQQLPILPPTAGKSASSHEDPVAAANRLGQILKAGKAVPSGVDDRPSRGSALAAIAAATRRSGAGVAK